MAKKKTKEVCGIRLTEDDEWAWELGRFRWRYCSLRLYLVTDQGERCAGFYAKIEGAVGYSMGYVDGWNTTTHLETPPAGRVIEGRG